MLGWAAVFFAGGGKGLWNADWLAVLWA